MKNFSMKLAAASAAIIAAGAMATPAHAARTLCVTGPGIDLVAQPCVWSPGPPGNDFESEVEAAILAATGTFVDLAIYGKSDENASLFNFNVNPDGVQSVNWSTVDGTLINYISVKAANEFKVYQLAGAGASSGTANTLDLLTPNGRNQPNISHISFWTTGQTPAVPEPGTWLMLLLGFFGMGGVLRRDKAKAKADMSVSYS